VQMEQKIIWAWNLEECSKRTNT